MAALYERAKTHPLAESLRQIQLELISKRLSHPYYWAAFILSGVGIAGN